MGILENYIFSDLNFRKTMICQMEMNFRTATSVCFTDSSILKIGAEECSTISRKDFKEIQTKNKPSCDTAYFHAVAFPGCDATAGWAFL